MVAKGFKGGKIPPIKSKQALESICDTCNNSSCPWRNYEKSRCVYYNILQQSLERVEKLEELIRAIFDDIEYADLDTCSLTIDGHAFIREELHKLLLEVLKYRK